MVFFLGHGLVKDLCLLEANLKAKELSSICKGGFDLLQSSFCVGNKGSVIWGLPFLGLGVGVRAPQIGQTAVQVVLT